MAGIVYLENNLHPAVFSEERLKILQTLSAQAAISIDNALLYRKLEQKIEHEIAAKNKLRHLNLISTQLAQLFDREQVLTLFYDALEKEAGISRSSLYLTQGQELYLFATLPSIPQNSSLQLPARKVIRLGEGVIGAAAKRQEILYLPNTRYSQYFPINPAQEPAAQPDGAAPQSLLCIPLLDGNLLLGIISLTAPVACLEEESQERTVAEALCGFLAISLKNIQLVEETRLSARMEAELQTARAVQHSLLPEKLPELPNLELAGYYQSASETGGDWYGVNDAFENALYIMIGDVTGHGTPSALVTASVCAACQTLTDLWHDLKRIPTPADILHYLNKTVEQFGAPDYLMTFFVARPRPAQRRIDLRQRRTQLADPHPR